MENVCTLKTWIHLPHYSDIVYIYNTMFSKSALFEHEPKKTLNKTVLIKIETRVGQMRQTTDRRKKKFCESYITLCSPISFLIFQLNNFVLKNRVLLRFLFTFHNIFFAVKIFHFINSNENIHIIELRKSNLTTQN